MYNNQMKLRSTGASVFYACVIACTMLLIAPLSASAQFVPVNDATLISDFSTFSANFDSFSTNFDTYARDFDNVMVTNNDSIRNIITGSDLTTAQVGNCLQGDNMEGDNVQALAYAQGPWASSSAETALYTVPLPLTVPAAGGFVQVNYSHSLRCLLEDMVEWQKLGLSIQINQMLKTYISDAQSAQLKNQLLNKVSAANINYINNGNIVVNNGAITSTALYNTNATQNIYNVKERQLEHALDQAAADPTAGNPVGSWDVYSDWRLPTAANMASNARDDVEDPFNFTTSITQSTMGTYLAPGTSGQFFEDFNSTSILAGSDGITTFDAMLNNSANSPLGAMTLADQVAQSRLQNQEKAKLLDMNTTGFGSALKCSGRPDDIYCLEQQNSTAVTPAGEIQRSTGDSTGNGNQQLRDATGLDQGPGSSAEAEAGKISEDGLNEFDTTKLQTSQTAVNKLVKEFYDVINVGYFGVHQDSREWAQATMLMIYDEMKFDPTSTALVVSSGTDEVDTGYSGDPDP